MADHASQLGTGEQPQCRGDLVVPTPAGVELGPGLRSELGDAPLDRGMDVLVGLEILEASGLQLSVHQLERVDQCLRFGHGEDAGSKQAVNVRH